MTIMTNLILKKLRSCDRYQKKIDLGKIDLEKSYVKIEETVSFDFLS